MNEAQLRRLKPELQRATDAPVDAVINADFRRLEDEFARRTGHGTAPETGVANGPLWQLHRAAAVNVFKRPFPNMDKAMDDCQYSTARIRVGGPSLRFSRELIAVVRGNAEEAVRFSDT